MTYCLGWTSKTAVFLIADSAVTYHTEQSGKSCQFEKTTFGEQQGNVNNNDKFVYENSFKLYSSNNIAFTFSGEFSLGNEIITLIKDNLEIGTTISQSINNALQNFPSFDSYGLVQILVAYYEDKPKLYVINNKENPHVTETDEFVSFGTPTEDLKEYTLSFYNSFKESREKESNNNLADEIMLVRMAALLQSYGTNNPTIGFGIGGAYSGLYVTNDKIHWHPDSYYLVHGENPAFNTTSFASIYIRNSHKYLITDKACHFFMSGFEDQLNEAKIQPTFNELVDSFDKGIFKYVIFLNFSRHVATIIHMNFKREHAYLYIDTQNEQDRTIGLVMLGELSKIINDNFDHIDTPKYASIQYISYIPLNPEKLEKIINFLPKARIS